MPGSPPGDAPSEPRGRRPEAAVTVGPLPPGGPPVTDRSSPDPDQPSQVPDRSSRGLKAVVTGP